MIYEASLIAVAVFAAFVAVTLGLSFYLGSRAKSSQGYFAAHGQIPWFVNGVAFAGDYLSAASFLGICGMIAFYGYDGFLYSIGYLAGWVVALFVVAEPLKRMGRYTFADALDARFGSRGIRLAAGVSTLAVSVFYLIPQMVGAGVLVTPLLGFPHWVGVVMVGTIVILIVVTAGMVSTTWVQFLKGSLLVIFSTVLTVMILVRGFEVPTAGTEGAEFRTLGPFAAEDLEAALAESPALADSTVVESEGAWADAPFVRTREAGATGAAGVTVWKVEPVGEDRVVLYETQSITQTADGRVFLNGVERGVDKDNEPQLRPVGHIAELPEGQTSTGPLGPLEFFRTLQDSTVVLWGSRTIVEADGGATTVYFPKPTPGSRILRPG
ncbi:MAG: cation acetate symporter, partial [Planctomycetes bacterium]|nr:cation acetate symporter [Planctomycetota bacterium]